MRAPDQLPSMAIGLKFTSTKREVGLRAMARATGLSTGSLSTYLNTGKLPAKCDGQAVQAALRDLLHEAGANAREMARLFKPCILKTDFAHANAMAKKTGASTFAPAPAYPPTHYHVKKEDDDMLLAKQTLTQAARKQFGFFNGNPFDGEVTSAGEMFQNAEFGYCREAAWSAAMHGRWVAIVGESGAGKTTLLGDLEERIAQERKPVTVIKPSVIGMEDTLDKGKPMKASGILDAIIYTLDASTSPRRTMEAKTRQLQQMLEASSRAGNAHLLVIEEAHRLPVSTLKHLKGVHELRMGRKALCGILLMGQPELKAKLNPAKYDVREVAQRVEIVELMPLDGDLKAYLTKRAARSGKPLAELMEDNAVHALQARLTVSQESTGRQKQVTSMVYPLAVNNFMTAALNQAAELGAPVITKDVVMEV